MCFAASCVVSAVRLTLLSDNVDHIVAGEYVIGFENADAYAFYKEGELYAGVCICVVWLVVLTTPRGAVQKGWFHR